MKSDHRVLVGVIGAAHGVKGELRVKSYTGEPAALARYARLTSEDGRRTFEIRSWRPLKDDMGVARFAGIEDRDAAAALTNQKLFIERDRLPPPEEDEFYHADLVGLRAETADGTEVGRVVALQNYGAGDLLEIAPATGDTILVAFTRAFVPEVDIAGGRVLVADEAIATGEDQAQAEP